MDEWFRKQTLISIKHCAMPYAESIQILLVPQKIISFFKSDISGKWRALERTFSARSPMMPKLKLLGKYLYQVPLYLFRPFIIESRRFVGKSLTVYFHQYQNVCIFSEETCSSAILILLLHDSRVNFVFWTTLLYFFSQTFLLNNSISLST